MLTPFSETSMAPRHTFLAVSGILVAVVAISLTLWMTVPPAPPSAVPDGAVAPGSLPVVAGLGGDFRLPATTGGEVALSGLRGKIVLLNFGFTSCPDVCPMTLTRIGHVMRELERQGADIARVQPLFITFDPARDSLAELDGFLRYFHPSLIGLRGDDAQTAAVARQYKVIYVKQDSASAAGYVYQHSDYVYVIDGEGRVRLLVGGKDPEEALVEAVKRLLRDEEPG